MKHLETNGKKRPKMRSKTFGQKLKDYRLIKGLTQEDFVTKFLPEISLKTYQAWEQGYRNPNALSKRVLSLIFEK